MIIINQELQDRKDFIFQYNRMIGSLIKKYNEMGNRTKSMYLRSWYYRYKDINSDGLTLHIPESGKTLLECLDDEFIPVFKEFWSEYQADQGKGSNAASEAPKYMSSAKRLALPDTPPMPNQEGYTWDDFFDWCYRQPRRITVGDMATMLGSSKRTIEREKSDYEAQYGKQAIPNEESKFFT